MALSQLDGKKYEKFKKRITGAVRKFSVPGIDPEDATQSVLLAWMSKRGDVKQTIEQAVVDYIRTQYGSARTENSAGQRAIRSAWPASALGDGGDTQAPEEILDRLAGFYEDPCVLGKIELERFLDSFSGRQRFIVESILRGGTLREISQEIGVSESRISQQLKGIIMSKSEDLKGLPLSKTEEEVYSLLLEGLTNQQIGDKLFVTEKTIKFHLSNIYKKLGVKNRGGAMARGLNASKITNHNSSRGSGNFEGYERVSGSLSERASQAEPSVERERKAQLASLLRKEESFRSRMECEANKSMAREKSRGVGSFDEESISEWASF